MYHAIFFAAIAALLISAVPGRTASAWPDRYNDCLSLEDADDAEQACRDALTSPALSVLERSEVYRQLGALHRWNDRLEDAEASLDASLALVPESPQTLAEVGAVKFLQSDFEGAKTALSRAIAGGVPGGETLSNRGMVLQKLGEIKAALQDFDAAVQLSAENGEIWNNRANALCATGDVEGSYRDRIQALYNQRFTAAAAQTGMRKTGFYTGPSDGIWGYDSEQALRAWTEAGCPNAPASRLQ